MAKVAFPARCAVAVICGDRLVSQVYPASVAIEAFIDEVVELLDLELRRRGADGLEPGVRYLLHRSDGTRLDITKSLDELGIEDGTALVLLDDRDAESFEPHYESLSTGLARAGKALFAPVTAGTAAQTSLAIVGMIMLTVLGLCLHSRLLRDSWLPAAVAGTVGILVGAVALWLRRSWPDRPELAEGLIFCAAPALAFAVGAGAPGALAAGHLFSGLLLLAILTGGASALTRRHTATAAATVTVCVIGAAVAALRMWRPVPAQWLAMLVLAGLLALLTAAPTVALWVARIRPPHFGSVTGRDLFSRGEGMAADTVAPVSDDGEDESDADPTPSGAEIAAAARRANAVLTGICAAAAVVLPAAVWAAVMPGRPRGTAAAFLALLFVLIFISRGRSFADRKQAVAVVAGASAAFCAGVARHVVDAQWQSGAALVWGAVALVGFAAAGMVAALVIPVTRFTPSVRMAAEWLELTAIVVVLPLAAWISGLFAWVRMR